MRWIHKCRVKSLVTSLPSSRWRASGALPERLQSSGCLICPESASADLRNASVLGLRLLTRTSRSVSPTEAGERLLQAVGPRFEEIEAELAALSELREKPAGTIRITTTEHAAYTILWPKLAKVLPQYPDLKVEIIIEQGLTDIVAERYDAGVRLGEQVAKDMIAVRIGRTCAWRSSVRLPTSKSGTAE